MTARELLEKAWRKDLYVYIFTPNDFKQLSEQLCREQRDIDRETYIEFDDKNYRQAQIADRIINAKMPEL
jgi:hypothetical protein